MTMISYAQNGEDVVLNRLFHHGNGFYIDVGAHDPVHHSVTKHFYDRGWSGINVEPAPGAFREILKQRPRDINLNLGISDREGVLDFFEAPGALGWSTFNPGQAESLRARNLEIVIRQIPVTTLAQVCKQYVSREIDFLKVDAESHETEVLRRADWSTWRPRVVLVECGFTPSWEHLLLDADYSFALFDGINRYYIRAEDRGLLPSLAAMANALDDYVLYSHIKKIEGYEARLAATSDLTARQVRCARGLRRAALLVPGLPSLIRRIIPAA